MAQLTTVKCALKQSVKIGDTFVSAEHEIYFRPEDGDDLHALHAAVWRTIHTNLRAQLAVFDHSLREHEQAFQLGLPPQYADLFRFPAETIMETPEER